MIPLFGIPDLEITFDYHHIRVKDGNVKSYFGSDNWNETREDLNGPLSMFLLESCRSDVDGTFFAELEKRGLYKYFAEHCVAELRDEEILLKQVPPNEDDFWGWPNRSIVERLDNDRLLHEFRGIHQTKFDGCDMFPDYINRSGRYMKTMMKKECTSVKLSRIFRKSASFEDLRREIMDPGGFEEHITEMASRCITTKRLEVFQQNARDHIEYHDTNDPRILDEKRRQKKLEVQKQ